MSKKTAQIIDLGEVRQMAEFLQRCAEAADAFPLWVLDADHQPVRARINEWGAFKANFPDTCRVDLSDVGELTVSTVFLGYDVGYSSIRGGPPILFETMPGRSDVADRYATWDEAVAGHAAVVAELSRAA